MVSEEKLKSNKTAWNTLVTRPSYRKQCIWWVMSAKGEALRLRRRGQLIESSSGGSCFTTEMDTKKVRDFNPSLLSFNMILALFRSKFNTPFNKGGQVTS